MKHWLGGWGRGARWSASALVTSALVAVATPAHAELTDSEKGQVRSYLEGVKLGTVDRLRALIARPDLNESQVSDVLASALRSRPFDDAVPAYLEALVFGPASQASRSTVLAPIVQALLSRADAVLVQQPGDPMRGDGQAGEELLRIHRFVQTVLERAQDTESQGVAGLPPDARRRIAQAYSEHIKRHSVWLAFGRQLEGRTLLLRAQVALVFRAASEGLIERNRVAAALNLGSGQRGLFLRTGTLFDDGGGGLEARRREVIDVLENVPNGLRDVDLVLVSKVSRRGWTEQPRVLHLRTPLGSVALRRENLWPPAVRSADPEQAIFEAAWVAASHSIRHRLAEDHGYAQRVRSLREQASDKGGFGVLAPWLVDRSLDRDAWELTDTLSLTDFAAAPTTQLLLDVQRTVDLALMRSLAGRPESFNQLLLGLETLAPNVGASGREIRLGKVLADGIQPVRVDLVVEGDRITGLAFEGHRYVAQLDSDGRITELLRDGARFELGDLAAIQVATTKGNRWHIGNTELVRLHGRPEVGALGRRRFLLVGGDSSSVWDGVHTLAPSPDHQVSCRMGIDGSGRGGVLVRTSPGSQGLHGIALLLGCEERCNAQLVHFDGSGGNKPLGDPVALADTQPSGGFAVSLAIEGNAVHAVIASKSLSARLQAVPPPGHVGWIASSEARLSVRDWLIQDTSMDEP